MNSLTMTKKQFNNAMKQAFNAGTNNAPQDEIENLINEWTEETQ